MSAKRVAIIGASENRDKFGNKSVRAHLRQGWEVFPVHPTAKQIEGIACFGSIEQVPEPIHRVSMYVPPEIGLQLIEKIAAKRPEEFWLNPGSESDALIQRAKELGLNVIVACSIVDLGLHPAELG